MNILYTIMGWLRTMFNRNTDLRYAGKEHIHRIGSDIGDIKSQRDTLVGQGIVLSNDIKAQKETVDELLAAVKQHKDTGNEDLKNKAYAEYVKAQTKLNTLIKREDTIKGQIDVLNTQIDTLESSKDDVQDTLSEAANTQLVGKAMTKVEDVHTNLTEGPLAGAIEESKLMAATAEGKRIAREAKDNKDIFAYKTSTNVKSLDEI